MTAGRACRWGVPGRETSTNQWGDRLNANGGGNTRIFQAEWVLPVSSRPIQGGAVAVRGDTIAAVGRSAEVTAANPGAELVNLHHAILLPGFVNCHSHLEYAVFRGGSGQFQFR